MSSIHNFIGCACEYKVHKAHGILGVDFTRSILIHTPYVVPPSKKSVILTFEESYNLVFNHLYMKKVLTFFYQISSIRLIMKYIFIVNLVANINTDIFL